MNKKIAHASEIPDLAEILSDTFIQRRDLYARQLANGSYVSVRKPLTEKHLIAHLKGTMTLGAYVLSPDSQARFVVIDADDDPQFERVINISRSLTSYDIPSYLESSRRGGHLWFFLEQPTPGEVARSFSYSLLRTYSLEETEFFPKQDKLYDGPGSLIRLPFGVHRKDRQRYGFITSNGEPIAVNFAEQIRLLANPQRVTQAALERFIAEHTISKEKPKFSKKRVIGDTLSEQIKRSVPVIEFVGQYV
jgi:hypothetical protein